MISYMIIYMIMYDFPCISMIFHVLSMFHHVPPYLHIGRMVLPMDYHGPQSFPNHPKLAIPTFTLK